MSEHRMTKKVFSFSCRVTLAPQCGESVYNATTAGKAKLQHFYSVRDARPDTKYTEIRVRKVGAPHSSDNFIANAKYRGMPDLRCGQRVRVGDALGTIVGHNSSANFDVEFDDDSRYNGLRLSVHPSEIVLERQ